jgi:hypothetical protein
MWRKREILMIEKVDYKALWEQMCQRCDELDNKLAQRTWVGLTDEEIWEWFRDNTALTNESGIRIVRAIEAKLRSKNNG